MPQRFNSERPLILGIIGILATTALPAATGQVSAIPIGLSDVLSIDGTAKQGVPIVSDILMMDPALATSFPNLVGGVTDVTGNGVDGSDPRFLDTIEIITMPGNTPRPAYFPTCPSCTLLRAVEFGNTSPFLPPDSAGAIFVDDDQNPTEFIFQVALVNSGMVDGNGRLTGFDYLEQHQSFTEGGVLGNVQGQVRFLDSNSDGIHDVWRVDHEGDTAGGYGPPAFVLDIDIVTADLNTDENMDVVTFNDLFNVWDQLGGNSTDLSGQVYLPLTDDPTEPEMRTIVFNDAALDSATVAGGTLPIVAPVAGRGTAPTAAIPILGGWGMAILLTSMALAGWSILRRAGLAAA